MKRSEMLNIISESLKHRVIGTIYPPNYIVEDILLSIEKAGMLPPYNPTYLDHGSIMDCAWEPEIEMSQEDFDKLVKK